jgi:hypothetical protein
VLIAIPISPFPLVSAQSASPPFQRFNFQYHRDLSVAIHCMCMRMTLPATCLCVRAVLALFSMGGSVLDGVLDCRFLVGVY